MENLQKTMTQRAQAAGRHRTARCHFLASIYWYGLLLVVALLAQGREAAAQHSLPGPSATWQTAPPEVVFTEADLPMVPEDGSDPSNHPVQLDTFTMSYMLNFQNRQTEKQIAVLESQLDSEQFPRIILGAQLRASAMVGVTNTDNKFSYLGRFPPDFVGSTATDARMTHANAAAILHAAPGVSGYFETLFSDVFTFPTSSQGSFQVRQAYLVLGDLSQSPLYAFIGKKNISFGDFRTLSPFSQAMPWHYFAPLAEGAGVGYSADGLELTAMAINGNRGIRVADSPSKGRLNNFAANGNYTFSPFRDSDVTIGAGYLHGTIYDSTVAEHTNPGITGPLNGAWDAHGRVRFGRYYGSAEYVRTLKKWPIIGAPVVAYTTELGVDIPEFTFPTFLSASWGQGFQGAASTTFYSNSQLILGSQFQLHKNVQLSFEYIRSLGFAPLINITTVSDPNVIQNTYLVGLTVVL